MLRSFCFDAIERLSTAWQPVLYDKDLLRCFVDVVSVPDRRDSSVFSGDSPTEREETRASLRGALHSWVARAHAKAPSKAVALVHQCVLSGAGLSPESVPLLLMLQSSRADGSVARALLSQMDSLDRSFVFLMEKKARMVGEVEGLSAALALLSGSSDATPLPQLAEHVLSDFRSQDTAASALLRAVAMLVAFPAGALDRQLIDYLCWVPAKFGACLSTPRCASCVLTLRSSSQRCGCGGHLLLVLAHRCSPRARAQSPLQDARFERKWAQHFPPN